MAAAALADGRTQRQLDQRFGLARWPAACGPAPGLPTPADRRRWCRGCAPSVTSMAAPASRGVEPLASATVTSTAGVPAAQQIGEARGQTVAHAACSPGPARTQALDRLEHALGRGRRIEARADAVVGDAGHRVGERVQDGDAQHQGRLADRLGAEDRVLAVLVLEQVDVEDARAVAAGRDLVGAGRVGAQAALLVPPQLLGGEPAHALDEAALDLADVERRVQRFAAVVQDVDPLDPVFAGQGVDRRPRCRRRHRRSSRTAGRCRRPGPSGSWASVEAGRGQRDPRHIGLPDQVRGTGSPGCRPGPGWAGTRPAPSAPTSARPRSRSGGA